MRLTKNDMARVIVQALYNLPELPAGTDRRVFRLSLKPAMWLLPRYKTAHAILTTRVTAEGMVP
jgi:hypothetical protein